MSMTRIPVARERLRSPSPAAAAGTLNSRHGSPSGSGLEASLLQLIHNHQLASFHLREQTERAKKEAAEAAARVSEVVVEAVNGGVQESFINEKRIELEIRAVAAAVFRYKKETDHWIAASRAINTAIKEEDFHARISVIVQMVESLVVASSAHLVNAVSPS
ncbi:Biogenesis of lysosome-related organelles complex 1 subunit 1-like protein [Drosera capensis]